MGKIVDLKRLEDDNEFLVELVKLNQLALEKKSMEEFFNKAIDLLEYILCTENSSLALLLTESFIIIQKNSEIYLTDRPIIVEQLCNAFLIQFKYSKNEIYLNILKILTNCNGIFDIKNVENISKKTLKRIDPCIYECFDLRITLKLMNLYLIIDFSSFKMLFDDMMLDFFLLDDQVTEQSFERLLWYALISDNVEILRDEVTKYDLFIKSKREGVRIYRLLMNHLEGKDSLDLKRIYHTVNKIKTLDSLTNFEKVIISKLVLIQVEKKLKRKSKSVQTTERNNSNNNFKWPSTEVENKGNESENEYKLNEISPLRQMGYQITKMTRAKRWDILQKAVPAIGLRKVAYTIAGNVKLRKGQRNGEQKFIHAITEWEHDLAELKKKYYKNDFRWPNT